MTPAAEVLLIEDEEIDRQIVQELLALRGRGRVRVTEATGFHAGLDPSSAPEPSISSSSIPGFGKSRL